MPRWSAWIGVMPKARIAPFLEIDHFPCLIVLRLFIGSVLIPGFGKNFTCRTLPHFENSAVPEMIIYNTRRPAKITGIVVYGIINHRQLIDLNSCQMWRPLIQVLVWSDLSLVLGHAIFHIIEPSFPLAGRSSLPNSLGLTTRFWHSARKKACASGHASEH